MLKLLIWLSLALLFSTSTFFYQKNKMNIIEYKSNEFLEFEKNAKIKVDKAWDIHIKFLIEKWIGTKWYPLFFCIDNNYVFSNQFQPKMGKVSLNGLYIDANTGKIKYIIDSSKYINLKTMSGLDWYYKK